MPRASNFECIFAVAVYLAAVHLAVERASRTPDYRQSRLGGRKAYKLVTNRQCAFLQRAVSGNAHCPVIAIRGLLPDSYRYTDRDTVEGLVTRVCCRLSCADRSSRAGKRGRTSANEVDRYRRSNCLIRIPSRRNQP